MHGGAGGRPAGRGAGGRRVSSALARAIVRLRYVIVLVWIALAALAASVLPDIEEAQVGSLGDLVPARADAVEAELRSRELFGFPVLSRTSIVVSEPGGLSAAERELVFERLTRLNTTSEPPFENIVGAIPLGNDEAPLGFGARTSAIIGYLFIAPEIGQVGRTGIARLLAERLEQELVGAEVFVTGPVPARAERGEVIRDRLPLVELATLALVVFALAVYFRSVGIPILNVLAIGISLTIAVRLVAASQEAVGVSVPREVEPVIVVLLFGIVTDYAVFLVSRFRDKLEVGLDQRSAARETTAELLPVIVTAGLIIAGASSALLVAEIGFLRAFGPGLAVAVLVGMLVAVTLIPAVLAIAGRRLLWPSTPGGTFGELQARRMGRRRARSRAVALASSYPKSVAAVVIVVLSIVATGVFGMRVGNPVIDSLPAGAEPRRGFEAASRAFSPGVLSPTVIVVQGPDLADQRRELTVLQALLAAQPGVSAVVGPGNLPTDAPVGALVSERNDAARFFAVLATDPLGSVAVDRVDAIEDRLPRLLDRAGLPRAEAFVGGDTALIGETIELTTESLVRVAPFALIIVFVLLAVLLRALVAPLYLLAASVLALLASLGLTVYVFDELVGYPELTFFVPFAAAVLLLSLGSDYNVFLAGRIWDEARHRPLREAVRVGGAGAAAPITTAGLILALSFAALALIPIRSFQEIAFAMTAGLLIDAFIVRTLLVPALIAVVGRVSAWPGRMGQSGDPAA